MSDVAARYFETVISRLQSVMDSQGGSIRAAAEICADAIAGDLEQRYPDGDLMKFSDRSGRRTVLIFTFP